MLCLHDQHELIKDSIFFIGSILLLFVCREILTWVTKANHILTAVYKNTGYLTRMEDILKQLVC